MKVWAIVLAVLAAVAIAFETTVVAVLKVPFLLMLRLAGIVPQLSLAAIAVVAVAVAARAVARLVTHGRTGSAASQGLLSLLALLVGMTAAIYQLTVFATFVAPIYPADQLWVLTPTLVDGGTPLAFSLLVAAAAAAGGAERSRVRMN